MSETQACLRAYMRFAHNCEWQLAPIAEAEAKAQSAISAAILTHHFCYLSRIDRRGYVV
jgi:hypothetical protein